VYNKIDTLSIEEVDELARKPDSVVISIYMNLNLGMTCCDGSVLSHE
jgi:hypothetical protein